MFEAKMLNFGFNEYCFYCIVALVGYFPYQQQLNKCIERDMDFSDLRVKKDFKPMSNLLAMYK